MFSTALPFCMFALLTSTFCFARIRLRFSVSQVIFKFCFQLALITPLMEEFSFFKNLRAYRTKLLLL